MERLVDSFWLYAKDGKRYAALMYQEFIDASSMDGAAEIPGLKRCVLRDGTRLNSVDENTYKNILTGELLSSKPAQ
jgi:hypothetical protein